MTGHDNIAQILRTDVVVVRDMEKRLEACTGKKRVVENIYEDNRKILKDLFEKLGISTSDTAAHIREVLSEKVCVHDSLIFNAFKTQGKDVINFEKLAASLTEFSYNPRGYFLKKSVFKQLIRNNPPQRIMEFLGYTSVEELLLNEDVFEIGAALRFMEDPVWLNETFFRPYKNVTWDDFEEREIQIHLMAPKWEAAAKKFVAHKYHNISHLKEMGYIFMVPTSLVYEGQSMRTVLLLMHYLNEVQYYADMFQMHSNSKNFGNIFTSLLRGDVEESLQVKEGEWMIIQRYLAKDNPDDPRLMVPHINPEALHWKKAERMFASFGQVVTGAGDDFAFWGGLSWIGDLFRNEEGGRELISCNAIDATMSLIKKYENIKYIYHHQESLWNKIFETYFGEREMETIMKKNLNKESFNPVSIKTR